MVSQVTVCYPPNLLITKVKYFIYSEGADDICVYYAQEILAKNGQVDLNWEKVLKFSAGGQTFEIIGVDEQNNIKAGFRAPFLQSIIRVFFSTDKTISLSTNSANF